MISSGRVLEFISVCLTGYGACFRRSVAHRNVHGRRCTVEIWVHRMDFCVGARVVRDGGLLRVGWGGGHERVELTCGVGGVLEKAMSVWCMWVVNEVSIA